MVTSVQSGLGALKVTITSKREQFKLELFANEARKTDTLSQNWFNPGAVLIGFSVLARQETEILLEQGILAWGFVAPQSSFELTLLRGGFTTRNKSAPMIDPK